MRFSLVTLFSVLAVAFARPEGTTKLSASDEEYLDKFFENFDYDKYMGKFWKQVAEGICEKPDTNLEVPFEELMKRVEEVYKEDHSTQTVCAFFEKDLLYVTEPMVKAIDGCVSSDMTGIADYFIHLLVSAYHQICVFTGEEIMELAHPCLSDVDFTENECIKQVNFKEDFKQPFKKRVCSGFMAIRPCLEKDIKEKCKLPITQKSMMTFLDSALEKPCSI